MEDTVHEQLEEYLQDHAVQMILVICDQKVYELYPDYFKAGYFEQHDIQLHFFPIEATELNKTMNTVMLIFDYLMEHGFEKDSLIINWGGGIVSDIGGFVAAFFKRGVRLINLPTTLLAMVDAAHGGKNGVNFHHIKNGLGSIYFPDRVILNSRFLDTLPDEEILNGFAELMKSALLGIPLIWNDLIEKVHDLKSVRLLIRDELIWGVKEFKNYIVKLDPQDIGIRQILNFGHTIGHAIESYYLNQKMEISHGYAVAIGIFFEVQLSNQLGILSDEDKNQIQKFIQRLYQIPEISTKMADQIALYTNQDKKNRSGKVKFTALSIIGDPEHSVSVNMEQIKACLLN